MDAWMAEYRKICRELGISHDSDRDARDLIGSLIGEAPQPLGKLESLIRNRDVVIFGAGPSLGKGVKEIDKQNKTLIAADGTASCLLENGLYPDIIVTDLDGDINDLLLVNRFGALMVIHAHGDNVPQINSLLLKFKSPVVTTQVEPIKNVHNFFGFTDGDRAFFLAKHFGARKIDLIGFDFGDTVGKYSDPKDPTEHKASEMKLKKLGIAERLIKGALK